MVAQEYKFEFKNDLPELKALRSIVYIDPGMALDCHGNEIVLSVSKF